MLKQICALGLLSVAALGTLSLPAQADTAVIQQSNQDQYINGEGNRAAQENLQLNVNHQENSRRGSNTGIVQDANQVGTVLGRDNDAYQRNEQINVNEETNKPRHRRRGWGF
jgi:hypothetical protein